MKIYYCVSIIDHPNMFFVSFSHIIYSTSFVSDLYSDNKYSVQVISLLKTFLLILFLFFVLRYQNLMIFCKLINFETVITFIEV